MKSNHHSCVVLLRGINVSGKNKLPMAELRDLLAEAGFEQVSTYIQSGNIVLNCDNDFEEDLLSRQINELIKSHFGYDLTVLSIRESGFVRMINDQPFNTKEDELNKYHVTMLDRDLHSDQLIWLDELDQSITQVKPMDRCIYLYCPSGYGHSKYHNTFFERKLKCQATTRNWKTMMKLNEMLAK